jgi:hypothetical protein
MLNPGVRPTLLNHALVVKAVADTKFFAQVPEFLPLVNKLKTMKENPTVPGRGCGSCKQRRIAYNIYQDFVNTMSVLSPDAFERLKRYLGVPAIMFNARDPRTGHIGLRVV